jgi:hypothetical protein
MMVVLYYLEQTKASQPAVADSVSLRTNLMHSNMEPSGQYTSRESAGMNSVSNSLATPERASTYFTGENITMSEVCRASVCISEDRSSSMASMFELLPEIQPMMMFEERGTELSQRRSSAELVSIIPRMSA